MPIAWQWSGSSTGNQGQGVKVGILDSGAQSNNPALINRITWFKDYVDPSNGTPQDTDGHGTSMAELIGGAPNANGSGGNYFYGGVAPQSSLYIARVGGDSGQVSTDLISQALSDLTAQGVMLINNSYGSSVPITGVGLSSTQVLHDYSIFGSTANNGQLMIWAAGNNGNLQSSVEAGLPYWEPSLQSNWIAVVSVALNANGQVTGLDEYNGAPSNACGVAAPWCLAAPGLNYFSPVANTAFSTGGSDGTSDAAAIVTGAAALVWQRFPWFTASNVQQTLLGTATYLGSPSYYGFGLVNAAAAVNGPGLLAWGVFEVNIPFNGSGTFSNNIFGTGSIQLDGNGSLTLAGQNNFGGVVVNGGMLFVQGVDTFVNGAIVNDGALFLNGTINGNVTTNTLGTLMSKPGSVINGNVLNNGIVQTLNGPLTINGNFTVSPETSTSTAYTQIGLGNPLAVSGIATLNSTPLYVVETNGSTYEASAPILLLTAAGGINGTFGTLYLDGTVYQSASLTYTATQLDITFTQNSVSAVAKSMPALATTQQTAQHLQAALQQTNAWATSIHGTHQSFRDAASEFYDVQSIPQAQTSINSLSGQILASSQGLTLEQADIVNRTVADRLVDIGEGNVLQGVWFQGTGASGDIARGGYATGTYSGGGSVVGYDVKLAEDFMLGVGLDWDRLSSSYNLEGGNDTSRSTGTMLYAKWTTSNVYVSGRIGENWIHSDTSRWGILGVVPAAINSSRNDRMSSAYLELGYDAKSNAWTTTPFVSAGDEYLRRGAIAEHGAGGFGIAAASDDFNQSYAQVGARLGYRWNWDAGQLSLKGFALYQRVLSGRNLGFTAAYAGAPNATFELEGVNSPRNSGWIGVGLNAVLNNQWSWFANLDGQIAGGGTKAAVFSAGVRYRF